MGKHWRPGSGKPAHGSLPLAARAVAAAGVVAASVAAVNLATSVPEPGQPAGSLAQAGAGEARGGAATTQPSAPPAGSGGRPTDAAPTGVDQVGAGTLAPPVLSDSHAIVSFPHPAVGSFGDGGSGGLTIGPAGVGRPPAGFLMAPLQVLFPSSPFGFRISPLSGIAGDFHLGQDYAAPCGTTVYAADSGVVRAAGWHPWGGGNRVEIDHGDGLVTTYNHLESIGVRTGDRVQVGQAIARVGTTGWSTGCHLHFETIVKGRYVNPLGWHFLTLRALGQLLPAQLVAYGPGGTPFPDGRVSWTIPLPMLPDVGSMAAGARVGGSTSEGIGAVGAASPSPSPGAASPSPSPTTSDPTPSPATSDPTPSPATSDPTPSPTEPSPSPTPTTEEPAPVTTEPVPTTDPSPLPTEEPAPVTTEPEPTADPLPTEQPAPIESATPIETVAPVETATPIEAAPSPESSSPETSTLDPYGEPTATNSPYEEPSGDATLTPLPDPTTAQ
ncbi:M23 family metallopeptidase [Arthrobacter sp. C152]